MLVVTFHHEHFSVEPTRIAAQANAGADGFFGSGEHLVNPGVGVVVVANIFNSSVPVGTRAKALPIDANPTGGHLMVATFFAFLFTGAVTFFGAT